MQKTRSGVDFLAPVTEMEVVKTFTILLECLCPLAWDTILYNDLSYHLLQQVI